MRHGLLIATALFSFEIAAFEDACAEVISARDHRLARYARGGATEDEIHSGIVSNDILADLVGVELADRTPISASTVRSLIVRSENTGRFEFCAQAMPGFAWSGELLDGRYSLRRSAVEVAYRRSIDEALDELASLEREFLADFPRSRRLASVEIHARYRAGIRSFQQIRRSIVRGIDLEPDVPCVPDELTIEEFIRLVHVHRITICPGAAEAQQEVFKVLLRTWCRIRLEHIREKLDRHREASVHEPVESRTVALRRAGSSTRSSRGGTYNGRNTSYRRSLQYSYKRRRIITYWIVVPR